ncbi:MAG: nuclear transport factor 2 family protein [Bacteroidota bacterium]
MRKCLFLILISLLILNVGVPSYSYSQSKEEVTNINQQIWEPFIDSYASFDAEQFMSLHTEDVIRVPRDSKKIYVGDEYGQRMHTSFGRMKESGTIRSIEFRFLQRMVHKEAGYEVGYYKISTQRPGDQVRFYYGKFHVTLRKVNGTWKIAIDSDSSENNSITEEEFQSGKPL